MTSGASGNENWVALLGTKGGPAIRPGSTMPTSSLLCLDGHKIVVDCGLGVTCGLADQGMRLTDLSLIFITHLHSDHYLDLGPLLHTAWTAGLKSRVRVFGPADLSAYWSHFLQSMRYDIETRMADEGRPDLGELVEIVPVTDGFSFEEMGLRVTLHRVSHPPVVDAFAYKFEAAGRSIVISGDTCFQPTLSNFAGGADLLIHEAMLAEGVDRLVARVGNGDDRLRRHLHASHTRVEDAGRIAAMAGVRALALNHLVPVDDPDISDEDWIMAARVTWDGPLFLGKDGMRIKMKRKEAR